MCKKVLITGVPVARARARAEAILHNQVIPRNEAYEARKAAAKRKAKK